MKRSLWLPPVVFLASSITTVLGLQALDIGGEYRVWIAMAVGMVATAIAQNKLAASEKERDGDKS